ncbi:hypothetical protein BDZ89DRAFT_450109 [Hymenopellis radicata]|nr:hypothetical protein BDZ89DRAFT_450109 [Hymenopellis radicata]
MMEAHIALFPPIHDIPLEILTRIFSLTIDAPFDVFDTTDGVASPWALGTICRRWREVAWGTPRLWCSFRADWSHHTSQLCMEHVYATLAHSDKLDLSTNLATTVPSSIVPFIDHASRLSDLDISCTLPSLDELSILGDLSGLKKLRLEIKRRGPVRSTNGVYLDISSKAPLLVDVELQFDTLLHSRDILILPWTQLKRLKVRGLIIDRPFFPLCPNLVVLDDLAGGYALEAEEAGLRNELDAITTLDSLQILNTPHLQRLKHLRCPKLQVLQYQTVDIVDNTSGAILEDFLVRSQCDVHTLNMRIVDRKWDAGRLSWWQNFSAILSAVTVLGLEFYDMNHVGAGIFRSLAYDAAQTLFPCLQSLVIRTRSAWDAETELSVVRMLESRCKISDNRSKLCSVRIEYSPSAHKVMDELCNMEVLLQLKALEKDGLGVELGEIRD